MRLQLILLFFFVTVSAKPIQDADSVGLHYKHLADGADGKLKFVEQPENGKAREESATIAESTPKTQLLSTVSADSKLDEEVDSESSSFEEEEQPVVLLPTNATTLPREDAPTEQKLYVEEYQNDAAFDEKQELSAKKSMPQIFRSVNAVSTSAPEILNAPQPTQAEPITTPMHEETLKSKTKVDFSKQKPTPANEKQKPTELPPKPIVTQITSETTESPKQLEHEESVLEESDHAMDENDQQFGPKEPENHQQGAMIYVQPVPDMHGNQPIATFQPLITTEIPTNQQETTEKPNSLDEEKSWWQKFADGVACARGSCKGVFKTTTTAKPRELKPPTIIRRARHNKEAKEVVVVCRCLDKQAQTFI